MSGTNPNHQNQKHSRKAQNLVTNYLSKIDRKNKDSKKENDLWLTPASALSLIKVLITH